jgi:hypothetical protein
MPSQVNSIGYLQHERNHNMANSTAKLNPNTQFPSCSNFNPVRWHQPKSGSHDSTYESQTHAPQAVSTAALSEIVNTTMQVDSVAALVRACRDTVVEMGNWRVEHQLCRKSCTWSGDEARRLLLP